MRVSISVPSRSNSTAATSVKMAPGSRFLAPGPVVEGHPAWSGPGTGHGAPGTALPADGIAGLVPRRGAGIEEPLSGVDPRPQHPAMDPVAGDHHLVPAC